MDRSLNVVLIDDDATTNFLNKIILKQSESANLKEEFVDPEKALNYFKELDGADFPDVIFLDINMPIMNGWEFLEGFPGDKQGEAKIIMLTSSINPEDEEKARSIDSVFDYWSKPLSIEKIVDLKNNL